MNFNDVAIFYVKWSDYIIYFQYMSKDDVISIVKNSNLNDKKWVIFIFFSLCLKISETIYYRKNRETIINRAKKYDNNQKERLREKIKNKYRELSEKEKDMKRE